MSNDESLPILITIQNGLQKVVLNRPKKKNALTFAMYKELTTILEESAKNENIHALILTGAGDFYSSGNDLAASVLMSGTGDLVSAVNKSMTVLRAFINSLILYPKLLVAVVNGPAIGIAATTLALFDIVYASDKAYFHTPFSSLGLVAEGCSTYTFPKIMGSSKAGDMLYLGHKMSAVEAEQCGFISKLYRHDELDKVWFHLEQIPSLSLQSILASKRLVRKWDRETLLNASAAEVDELTQRWTSPDLMERFLEFLSRKSKI